MISRNREETLFRKSKYQYTIMDRDRYLLDTRPRHLLLFVLKLLPIVTPQATTRSESDITKKNHIDK